MALLRVIGRWALAALVINTIIGSGIFGVPSELIRLLGPWSPLVMIVAALAMATIAISIAEVASQFSEAGGLYLYARTAFGRFVGLQIGWFWLLAAVGGGAAGANLFVIYLGTFVPEVTQGFARVVTLIVLIAVPTFANYVGVRSGIFLSNLLTVSKLLPLALIILLGVLPLGRQAPAAFNANAVSGGWHAWLTALLLLVFSYGGYEDALVPMGEVKNPRRAIPFALGIGLLVCTAVYSLLQYVVVSTIGALPTDRPIVDTASRLLGHSGASFVAIAVMLSTYGWLSAGFLNAPRFAFSLAEQNDAPPLLGRLHPRFNTPSVGVFLYALLVGSLAITGTFLWVLALAAGSMMILYAVSCACLMRLRRIHPTAEAFRAPFGPVFAVIGIAISVVLFSQLDGKQFAFVALTASIAAANWWWAHSRTTSS